MNSKKIAGQSASITESIKTLVVKNTTSPNETDYGAKHYTLITTVGEILRLNIKGNLRKGYAKKRSEDVKKMWTPIHKEIAASFEADPERFLQKHLGLHILCDEIKVSSPKEYGINLVELSNASLINGAQTQEIINTFFEDDTSDHEYYKKINVRVYVIVEPRPEEQHQIRIALNSTTNVADLSRYGDRGVFKDLNNSMLNAGFPADKDGKVIAFSETDQLPDPATLLQVTRLFVSDEMMDEYESQKNILKSYRNKAQVQRDFAEMFEELMKTKKTNKGFELDIYNFFVDFAPIAWKEYQKWSSDKDWIKYWNSSKKNPKENSNRIGKYNKKTDTFSLNWGIVCPILYGLKDYIQTGSNGPVLEYPDSFDKEKYMKKAFDSFKSEHDFNPQDFGKNTGSYTKMQVVAMKMS